MRRRAGSLLLLSLGGACLVGACVTWASQTFTVNASFTPDKLGTPTNLATETTFAANGGTPAPLREIVTYAPAGMEVNVHGMSTCDQAKLEANGPSGCPEGSRIGFGGGVGLVQVGREPVKEPYTLDLFLGPRRDGRLTILIYVSANDPVSLQLVLAAREIRAPKPYGFGVAVAVPPIYTLPGAANASLESTYLSLGGTGIAYYRRVHGARTLRHVRGLVVPKACPHGGFPFKTIVSFENGASATGTYTSPCPRH
jgi:hypothetical protein